MKEGRYNALDTLRGFLLCNMIAYHALYDVVFVQGVPLSWYTGPVGYVWQQGICWGFILLSGFCSRLSRHPLRHGLAVLGAGLLVTIVTCAAMPSQRILYGVLWLLGLAGLIQWAVGQAWGKLGLPPCPAWLGLALCGMLFFVTRGVPHGYLGFEGLRLLELPARFYQSQGLALLGLPGPGFWSSDYFPLAPWLFLYLCGYFLWGVLSPRQGFLDKLRPGLRPLAFLGRHSLLVYLLHQPVLMLVFMLI